ncbi:MAG: lamin tail domain-containing protein [Flavobacteriales bacterium]|nr:lamin tail domain-containing protein [Flavobacteriales bacterium]
MLGLAMAPAWVDAQIAAWDFTGENTVATSTAEVFDANMDASNLVTRGVNAPASSGTNSFRTQGFQNDGISTANLDYFQITLSASTGYTLSLSTIDARLTGTSSYSAAPGASNQFAYSLDGTTFSLIGSPAVVIGTNQTIPQIDVTGIPALQNVADGVTITLRFYATGQTGTGGWGFYSNTSGAYGLAIGGTLTPSGPACGITLNAESAVCNSMTSGAGNDTYDLSIPYNGVQAGVTVINNSGSGSVGGDDPATVSNGTIVISGISEDNAYNVTFGAPCGALSVSGAAPSCEPAPAGTIINFDDVNNWTQGSVALTSYASDHQYASNDWSFTGGPALRQGTAAQDGFPGAFGTYSWRLQNVATVDWRATWQGTDIIDVFGFKVRRWDGSPSPAFEVSYSTDGGSTFSASVQTIDNTYLNNTSDWTTFSYTIPSPAAVAAGQFVVRVASTGTTERIMIDDFYFETSSAPPSIVINEIRVDQPGADNDEYFELAGPAGTSLDGLTYLVIGDGVGGSGVIESVTDLTGSTIPADGFFLAAESTFTLATADLVTTMNFENSDNVTHLLVADFTGLDGDDLDTNDDGVLDVTPWSSVVSSVALIETTDIPASGEYVYATDQVGPDGLFSPSHVYRCSSVWFIGPFDILGGLDSPGLDNPYCSCTMNFLTETATCNSSNPGPGDTYDLTIPYSGMQPGVTVINNSGSGTVGGDDPATVANGTIVISGINETDNYDVALSSPCDQVTLTGNAPLCEPPLVYTIVINEVDYDQAGTDDSEFIELYNYGAFDLPLNGLSVVLVNGSNNSVYETIPLNSVMLAAGDYYVICTTANTVPNCDQQVTPATNWIQNGAPDAMALLDPDQNILDALSYEGDVPGYTEGTGTTAADNTDIGLGLSRLPDGNDTDDNDADFTLRCISPGASNLSTSQFCLCEPPTVQIYPTCIDQLLYQINVVVTALGSSATVDITDDLYGYQELGAGVGSYVLGPYVSGDVVTVTVAHDQYSDCDVVVAGITKNCAPPPPCFDNEVSVQVNTDTYPSEISWLIQPAGGGSPVCTSSSYYQQLSTVIETCCLPDGCYELVFFDSFGDGIDAPGGYILRDPNGKRILDSDGTFSNVGTADQAFCVPIGAEQLVFLDRDREDWLSGEFINCQEDPNVSAVWIPNAPNSAQSANTGYQFWFLDPDGGYSRRIFRGHNTSGGFGPASATRACHLQINSWVTLPLPSNVLLNVRVRARVNGVYDEFGPASRFRMIDAPIACPTTKLIDDPGNSNYSCDVARTFGGSDKVYCYPRSGANKYQFSFRIFAEGFMRNIASNTPSVTLNWVAYPLEDGKSYDVLARISKDGGNTWCDWGDSCLVTISVPAMAQSRDLTIASGDFQAQVYPNPTHGDRVYLLLNGLTERETTVHVDVIDVFGQLVQAFDMPAQGPAMNAALPLDHELASGMYMVHITTDERTNSQRLMVQR